MCGAPTTQSPPAWPVGGATTGRRSPAHACLRCGGSPVLFSTRWLIKVGFDVAGRNHAGFATRAADSAAHEDEAAIRIHLIQPPDRAACHEPTFDKRSVQGLGERVDLIVISASRKLHELLPEVVEPERDRGSCTQPASIWPGVPIHTHDLVHGRLHWDGTDALSLEVLDQAHARTLILDQQSVAVGIIAPAAMEIDDFPPEIRVIEPFTHNIQMKASSPLRWRTTQAE